jgi:hypothetical protein
VERSRGGDVVAVNSWQSRFGIVLIVVRGGNKHENDPEAGSPNTYVLACGPDTTLSGLSPRPIAHPE